MSKLKVLLVAAVSSGALMLAVGEASAQRGGGGGGGIHGGGGGGFGGGGGMRGGFGGGGMRGGLGGGGFHHGGWGGGGWGGGGWNRAGWGGWGGGWNNGWNNGWNDWGFFPAGLALGALAGLAASSNGFAGNDFYSPAYYPYQYGYAQPIQAGYAYGSPIIPGGYYFTGRRFGPRVTYSRGRVIHGRAHVVRTGHRVR